MLEAARSKARIARGEGKGGQQSEHRTEESIEQLARSLRGAGWRSCSPPSVPLLPDSFFVVGALWSLPTLLGDSTAERTEQHRRRCLARGLPRLAKLGLLLGCHMNVTAESTADV